MEQTDQTKDKFVKKILRVKAIATIKPYKSPILFPQRLQKYKLDKQYTKFFEVFKKLYINIPFVELRQIFEGYFI